MEATVNIPVIFGFLDGVEVVCLLAVVLILFGLNPFIDGRPRFRSVLRGAVDDTAKDIGRSVGGITGSPTFQAITPQNEVAELYDPRLDNKHRRRLIRWWKWFLGIYVRARSALRKTFC